MDLPPVNFEVRPVANRADETAKVCQLFRDTVPESPSIREDYITWLYFDNPDGSIIGFNAWDGDTLAAHYVVMPIEAEYRGAAVRAALSLNTATHPNYQRRGLFVRLAEATYDACKSRGLHHIVGVANANSTPGFLTKLSFQDVGRLDAWVGLGMPNVGEQPEGVSWRRKWGASSLSWRLKNPAARYRAQTVGSYAVVMASTGTLGIQCVMKMESDPALAEAIRNGLGGGHYIGPRLWMGLSQRITPGLTSMEVPERFRKSPLNLIFRPLQDDATIERSTVEFEAIDFDAF